MVCVYFPTKSVSAVNYDSVSEAIRQHVANGRNVQGEDVLVIRFDCGFYTVAFKTICNEILITDF